MVSVSTDDRFPETATVWLRPVERLTRGGLWFCVALVIAMAWVGAWISIARGNVFAPFFALLESVGLATAFAAVWKGGRRGERITLDASGLEVTAWPGGRRTSYPTGWVRVRLEPGAGRQRLVLRSHGRETEIGAFLADEERVVLAHELRTLLADAGSAR